MSTPAGEQHITSPQNARVKELVALRKDGVLRRELKRFLLEGRRGVAAALDAPHVTVHEVIYCEHLLGPEKSLPDKARDKGVPLVRVSKDVFKKIADVMTPQGIAAVVAIPEWDLDRMLAARDALLVAACGIQDPGNLGTLIRSCEAAGAAGLVMLEGTAEPFNPKVVRSTAAGLLNLPMVRLTGAAFLDEAHRRGLRLVATAARGGRPYLGFDWRTRPLALCIGSEAQGLPADVEAACKEKVTIPMRGAAESLNAAVAASILLFAAQEPGQAPLRS
jgi:TrmH family RNA methyltransferase